MKVKGKMNRVTVKILNEEHVVKGDADRKHIEKIAAYLDNRMREIALKDPYLSPKRVAVLAALNITNELFQLKEDYASLTKLLDEVQEG